MEAGTLLTRPLGPGTRSLLPAGPARFRVIRNHPEAQDALRALKRTHLNPVSLKTKPLLGKYLWPHYIGLTIHTSHFQFKDWPNVSSE